MEHEHERNILQRWSLWEKVKEVSQRTLPRFMPTAHATRTMPLTIEEGLLGDCFHLLIYSNDWFTATIRNNIYTIMPRLFNYRLLNQYFNSTPLVCLCSQCWKISSSSTTLSSSSCSSFEWLNISSKSIVASSSSILVCTFRADGAGALTMMERAPHARTVLARSFTWCDDDDVVVGSWGI